ncbi:MAG: PhoH family protein [Chlorobi bacterium]|nr:PhoH family protein [Chlorobiota bacterium]
MIEKLINIDTINPLSLYGTNDGNFKYLKTQFPKLKIIARGNMLKVNGSINEVEIFNMKINQLIEHIEKYNNLSRTEIEKILDNRIEEIEVRNKDSEILLYGNFGKVIKPRTRNQFKLVEEFYNNDLLFAIGPAGTGKTYTSIALAVKAWRNKEVKRIVLSRPAVEAGENLGFLPGDLKEKVDPYLQPLYDALFDMLPSKKLEDLMEDGVIEIAPIAFMRGRTLENAFVILDEAQNATENQLKMFLTRMGENSKFIVTGDITQIDLPRNRNSGLLQAIKLLNNIEDISFVYFGSEDIVRHKLVKDIVHAYNKEEDKEINDNKTKDDENI